MDDLTTVCCGACRHQMDTEDVVRTVDGRRFHASCVDAHHAESAASRDSVTVVARFIGRYARVLRPRRG